MQSNPYPLLATPTHSPIYPPMKTSDCLIKRKAHPIWTQSGICALVRMHIWAYTIHLNTSWIRTSTLELALEHVLKALETRPNSPSECKNWLQRELHYYSGMSLDNSKNGIHWNFQPTLREFHIPQRFHSLICLSTQTEAWSRGKPISQRLCTEASSQRVWGRRHGMLKRWQRDFERHVIPIPIKGPSSSQISKYQSKRLKN